MIECDLCGISSQKLPIFLYYNEDFSRKLYLCQECHDSIVKRTKGIIPLNLFKPVGGGEVEEWRGEEAGYWNLTQEFRDLSGELSLILRV